MADTNFDLIVVGGGPGGYVAAIRAAQLDMKVALVENQHLGGICLNWGCIPTKALLRSAEIFRQFNHAKDYGLSVEGAAFDLKAIVARSRKGSKKRSMGVGYLLKKNKVEVIDGYGKLAGSGKVNVTKDNKPVATLSAKHIILATGARARELPGMEPDGQLIWYYKDALVPDCVPERLLVIGAGSGGLVTSYIGAATKGKVALIEKHKMGGDCLNTGCVPSKALIRSAKFMSDVKKC